MKYTEEEKKCMNEYHKMILNNMIWKVTNLLEGDKELERKINKILEIVPTKEK